MRKFTKLFSIALLIGVFTLSLSACGGSKQAQDPAKSTNTPASETKSGNNPEVVTIGYQAGAEDHLLVKEKGWFEQELAKQGIKVKYVSFNAGRDINSAILTKSIDFGNLGDPPVTIAVSNNIPYEAFWLDDIIGDSEALIVKNKANVNSIKDLKGKKIATTVSSTSHYSLLSALKLEGLEAKDVQVVDLNPTDIVAAWQRGDIDAAYTWQPHLSKLLEDGKKLISSKDLAAKGAPTSNINIVRKEFGEKYPQIVSLYIKQLIRAKEEFKKDPDGTAEVLAKALQIDKAEALKQANEVVWITPEEILSSKYFGTSSQKGDFAKSLKAIGDFLVDQKALPAKLDVPAYAKVINPKYLEDALKK